MAVQEISRLGVNIDHIATLRQLRGTPYPDLLTAARMAEDAGAEQITVHLREDRRHIQDDDVLLLRKKLRVPLNLEMAVRPEMVRFARKVRPDWVCLVPEKRQEVTTEGGLDLTKNARETAKTVYALQKLGIRVSLFIEPTVRAVQKSADLLADAVELHTGSYCIATQKPKAKRSAAAVRRELGRVVSAAEEAVRLGLHAHAGHGLDYENIRAFSGLMREGSRLPLIEEYNIGHAIVCRAALVGMERAVREMVSAIATP